MTFYTLITDGSGNAIGSHAYAVQPQSLPANEVPCTAAQAANPSGLVVTGGNIGSGVPTLAEQAGAMLAAGIQIVCTSNSALSGTYGCDMLSISRMGNLLAAIAAGITLPAPVIAWADVNGAPHGFSVAEFKNLASAILNFELQLFPIANGAPGSLPTLPVTIA